eukprot:362519-Chlamydomonas_euryale.AAC.9
MGPSAALRVLGDAFCEGDVVLVLNVPPHWDPSAGGFAPARPAALWDVYRIDAAIHAPGGAAVAAAGEPTKQDLWGRSLPQQSLGDARATAGAFVPQDNTTKVIMDSAAGGTAATSAAATATASPVQLPSSFTIHRDSVLSDDVALGDVDAVFSGAASVAALQTWPHGHPFSLRDEVMLQTLAADASRRRLPRWLTQAASSAGQRAGGGRGDAET